MGWYMYVVIGLAAGVAVVWGTALVLCANAGAAQVLMWEKPCTDEAGGLPEGTPPFGTVRRMNNTQEKRSIHNATD